MKMKNCKLVLLLGLILGITACSANSITEQAPLITQEYGNAPASPADSNPSPTDTDPSPSIQDSLSEGQDIIGDSSELIDNSELIIDKEKDSQVLDIWDKEEPIKPPIPSQLSSPKIIVKKSARILELWDGDTLFGTYPIGLGFNPVGHKAVQGDGRTPEGNYYVCTRNPESQFYKSLGVSYPNKEDAEAALDTEVIEAFTYQSIANSIDAETRPPWDTPMGGAIMIHGHGSHEDWTEGCVAVNDDIMDILWEHCPINTPITILP